jgi:hypothetical protein
VPDNPNNKDGGCLSCCQPRAGTFNDSAVLESVHGSLVTSGTSASDVREFDSIWAMLLTLLILNV